MQGVELGAEVRRVTSDIGEVPPPPADFHGSSDPVSSIGPVSPAGDRSIIAKFSPSSCHIQSSLVRFSSLLQLECKPGTAQLPRCSRKR